MHGFIVDAGPCPYLPDQRFHAFHPHPGDIGQPPYRQLMDARFRRSGDHLYAPVCRTCDACRPLRVDVHAFQPRRDQRRNARRNADLIITWQPRGLDAERLELYHRYQAQVHGKSLDAEGDPSTFLVADGGTLGGELHARNAAGTLLAVSSCDRFDDALSSVYCYYDPAHRDRALGTFMVLAELAFCRQHALPWLYLGFHIAGCGAMAYKARFVPHDLLVDGRWQRRTEPSGCEDGSAT